MSPPSPPPARPPFPPPGSSPELELLARVAAGDRAAFEQLYRSNAGWLLARLQQRCADRELVDIALQDTFVAVWRNPGAYRGTGDVGAWLWGIAVRRLIDQLRKRRPAPVDPTSLPVDGPSTASASAEAHALDARIGGPLGEAFAALEPDLQQVLLVTAVDGLTTAEAAVLLGIPQGTVKTRLSRARARMQERLP